MNTAASGNNAAAIQSLDNRVTAELADTPPLVAVKVQPRLSQSSGPAEAAPVMVSVAPASAPLAAKLAALPAPKAVSVPVDTSPTVVKFPALAVLLMVSVLPVIPVAELSRPTLATPLMLSELPDTAPVDLRGSVDGRLQRVSSQGAGVRLGGLQPRDGGVSARELGGQRRGGDGRQESVGHLGVHLQRRDPRRYV